MPHLVRAYQRQQQTVIGSAPQVLSPKELLQLNGPLVQVSLSLTKAVADDLVAKGEEVPAPYTGFALIDTGASETGIDEGAVQVLGLPVIDRVEYLTPSTESGKKEVSTRHPVSVMVAGSSWTFDAKVTSHKLAAQNLVLLIGRDVLASVNFTYHGEFGFFTVSH